MRPEENRDGACPMKITPSSRTKRLERLRKRCGSRNQKNRALQGDSFEGLSFESECSEVKIDQLYADPR